jgi:hypothetical protein
MRRHIALLLFSLLTAAGPAVMTEVAFSPSAFAEDGDPPVNDSDGDGVSDENDNCVNTYNPDQSDVDGDLTGDACDDIPDPVYDNDGDGVEDSQDNCPNDANSGQDDSDGDGYGDACDTVNDSDNDGADDSVDNCGGLNNPGQEDTDHDGIGDACDASNDLDSDADGVLDVSDNCVDVANLDQVDSDHDGAGDACDAVNDSDSDGDGVVDSSDRCPKAASDKYTDGCPRTRTTISLAKKNHPRRLAGKVDGPRCVSNRKVELLRVRRGENELIEVTATTSRGSYSFARPKAAGHYYVRAMREVRERGICLTALSTNVRVKKR